MTLETRLLHKLPCLAIGLTSIAAGQNNDMTYGEYVRLMEFRKSGRLCALFERSGLYQNITRALVRWLRGFSASEACAYDPASLEQLDSDLQNKPIDIRFSMEGQLFNRFRLLCGIISSASISGKTPAFEMLAILLTESASEMLGLLNSIDRTNTTTDNKLKETIHCFAAFHTALVSWFLLQATDAKITSPSFRRNIHDHHLSPLL